jgi:imidazolonepropionase-like amidohydrolase
VKIRQRLRRWIAGAALATAWAAGPAAQAEAPDTQPVETQPATQPATQPTTGPTTTAAATTAATTTATTQAAEEKKDRFLAVVNGRVHTVAGPVLEKSTVLAKNGVIAAIGRDVQLPPECQVVDAAGLDVYPGFIAAAASGIHGADDVRDTTNVYGTNMAVALAAGITTAVTGNTAAKLSFGTTEDLLLKSNVFVELQSSRRAPLERAQLIADFERVRGYLRDLEKHERARQTDPNAAPPDKEWLTGKFENLRKLLTGDAIAVMTAGSTQDCRDAAELASRYGFRLTLRGAHEGWTAASELGRAGVGVILTPRSEVPDDRRYNRPTGSTIESARILYERGVSLAVVAPISSILYWGVGGRDLLHLNLEAAFTVRGGLTNEQALETLTIGAARVLGLSDRIGSLEVGKDADLFVADGDILHYMTQVRYTVVNGRVAYDKAKDTLFAHIRPEGRRDEVPEFDDIWPRRLEWRE